MVADDRPGMTMPEIAEVARRSLHTVTKEWRHHPEWPDPIGRRGRYYKYDRAEVLAWIEKHATADEPAIFTGDPGRLLTVAEIADESGLSEGTIRADLSLGRLTPKEGDVQRGSTKLWHRGNIADQLRKRRARRRSE